MHLQLCLWLDMASAVWGAHYVLSSAHFHTCKMLFVSNRIFLFSFWQNLSPIWRPSCLWGTRVLRKEQSSTSTLARKQRQTVIRRRDTWSRWLITGDMHNDNDGCTSQSECRRCSCRWSIDSIRRDSSLSDIVHHCALLLIMLQLMHQLATDRTKCACSLLSVCTLD